MPNNKISQAEFASQLRLKLPELKEFSDNDLINKVIELRPDLKSKIETPDDIAAREQSRLEVRSHSAMDPEVWKNHPKLAQIAKSTLSALPGTGMILGGMAATPETLGGGTIAGGALGAGAGRGLQDIANQILGLDYTTPREKAINIGKDIAISAITPGLLTALKNPVSSARIGAGMASKFENAILPRGLRSFLKPQFLEDFAQSKPSFDPLVKPPEQFNNLPLDRESYSRKW